MTDFEPLFLYLFYLGPWKDLSTSSRRHKTLKNGGYRERGENKKSTTGPKLQNKPNSRRAGKERRKEKI